MTQLLFVADLCALGVVCSPFLLLREIRRQQWWHVFNVAAGTISLFLVGLYAWPLVIGYHRFSLGPLPAALFSILVSSVNVVKHFVPAKKQAQRKTALAAFDSHEGIWPPPPSGPAV